MTAESVILRRIERASRQIEKQREALQCGDLPFSLIERPIGMYTRDFNRRMAILAKNEAVLIQCIQAYMGCQF